MLDIGIQFFAPGGNQTSTATLTIGNGITVEGNTITIRPNFTPKAGTAVTSFLTFSKASGGETINIPVSIFQT